MGDEQDQERDQAEKKPRVRLRDLTASKEIHIIGGASGNTKFRDLTASKGVRIIRESGKSGGQEES
jgi:hypothetical protein